MAEGESKTTEQLPWQHIGEAMALRMKRICQRVYAKDGKRDDLVLIRHQQSFYALEAWCSHQGGPLYQGDIEDFDGQPHVMCPWHAYMFDIKTGLNNECGIRQEVHEVKVELGQVYVRHKSQLSLTPFTPNPQP